MVSPRLHQVNPTQAASADRQQHAGHYGHDPADCAADRLVQRDLRHQQRRQRRQHRPGGDGQQQGEQVRQDRRAGQPGYRHRRRLGAVTDDRQALRCPLRRRQGRNAQLPWPGAPRWPPAQVHDVTPTPPMITSMLAADRASPGQLGARASAGGLRDPPRPAVRAYGTSRPDDVRARPAGGAWQVLAWRSGGQP